MISCKPTATNRTIRSQLNGQNDKSILSNINVAKILHTVSSTCTRKQSSHNVFYPPDSKDIVAGESGLDPRIVAKDQPGKGVRIFALEHDCHDEAKYQAADNASQHTQFIAKRVDGLKPTKC